MSRIKVEVTHPDRVLFPDTSWRKAITKRELVEYYGELAETMLPHLKGRPLTVQRFPRGIDQQGFFQQDFADMLPDWMRVPRSRRKAARWFIRWSNVARRCCG